MGALVETHRHDESLELTIGAFVTEANGPELAEYLYLQPDLPTRAGTCLGRSIYVYIHSISWPTEVNAFP